MNQVESRMLLCRVHDLHCAIPLEHVAETMRPLPVESIAGMPAFVAGMAIVRGSPIPVVDAAWLLCGMASPATRFVIVKSGDRHIALAVEAVTGVVDLSRDVLAALPPLLQGAHLDAVAGVGTLDGGLLIALQASHLMPDDVWTTFQAAQAAA